MNIFQGEAYDLKVKPQTLSERVYDKLLDMIMSNEMKADARLNVDELAKQFGVSKTPLREALKSLEKTGLVLLTPYAGYSVKKFTAKEIEEIYKIRILLEVFAVDYIVKNVAKKDIKMLNSIQEYIEENADEPRITIFKFNRKFHDYFYMISDHPKLCEMIGLLWDNLSFFRMLMIQDDNYIENMKIEHHRYIEALAVHDGDRLKTLIEANLRRHADQIPELLHDHYK